MNALYLGAVASQLLHAAAVALAAAPDLKRIHCVVEREGIGLNAHEPIYRGTISQELIDTGENEPDGDQRRRRTLRLCCSFVRERFQMRDWACGQRVRACERCPRAVSRFR